jgi:hypothetical protein
MDFFDNHGLVVLVCLALFPRLTLLLANFASGGFLWWLGWLVAPHFLVAILAIPYWEQNPVLVVFAWLFAFAGTGGETKTASSRKNRT